MRHDFGARVRYAVGVIGAGSGSVAKGNGLGREIPLRDSSRELHIVVLLAGSIPLGNPARGERRRRIGWPVAAGGSGACHVWKGREKETLRSAGATRIGFWCCVSAFASSIARK